MKSLSMDPMDVVRMERRKLENRKVMVKQILRQRIRRAQNLNHSVEHFRKEALMAWDSARELDELLDKIDADLMAHEVAHGRVYYAHDELKNRQYDV